MRQPNPQILTRRNAAYACGLLAVGAVALTTLLSNGGSTAKASTPSLYSAYPALNSREPTGLPVITAPSPNATPTGPVFLASPPQGATSSEREGWPEPASIRKLPVDLPIASAWIARNIAGGICILDARHQPVKGHYGVGVSCSEPSRANSGTYLESSVPGSSVVTIMGVVPVGVSAIEVTLTDGSTKKVPVSDNAWGLEAEAHLKSTAIVAGG